MTEQENTIVLVDEEGREHQFLVMDVLELDDEEYAVLLPDEAGNNGEAVILKIGVDEAGQEVLYEIEDEEEWKRVAAALEELWEDEDEVN